MTTDTGLVELEWSILRPPFPKPSPGSQDGVLLHGAQEEMQCGVAQLDEEAAVQIFNDFSPTLRQNLQRCGWGQPNSLQLALLLAVCEWRHDCVLCASPGTGKTLAFLMPIVNNLLMTTPHQMRGCPRSPRAIIFVPTRELALQVTKIAQELLQGSHSGLTAFPIIGGGAQTSNGGAQSSSFVGGIYTGDICVGCTGRLLDLVQSGRLSLSRVQWVVLDEYDRLLCRREFSDPLTLLLEATDRSKTMTILSSATAPDSAMNRGLALLRPAGRSIIRLHDIEDQAVVHHLIEVPFDGDHGSRRDCLETQILATDKQASVLVFVHTISQADSLCADLLDAGWSAAAFHSAKLQDAREEALATFESRQTQVLIATDMAARGIDFAHAEKVVHFWLPDPKNPEEFHTSMVHRNGRTGRWNKEGVVYTFWCERHLEIFAELLVDYLRNAGFEVPLKLSEAAQQIEEKHLYKEDPKSSRSLRIRERGRERECERELALAGVYTKGHCSFVKQDDRPIEYSNPPPPAAYVVPVPVSTPLPAAPSTSAIVEHEYGDAVQETPVKTTHQYYTHSNSHASSPHVVTPSTPMSAPASSSSSMHPPHQQHQQHQQGYVRHTGGTQYPHQQASLQPANAYYPSQQHLHQQHPHQHHQQMQLQHEHKYSQYGKYGWQQQHQQQHYSPQHAGRPPYAQYAAYGSPGHMHEGYQQQHQQLQYQQQLHYQHHHLQHEPYHHHQQYHPHLQEQHQEQYYHEYPHQAAQQGEEQQQYEEYEPHHRRDTSSEGPPAVVAKETDAALPPAIPVPHTPSAERGVEQKLEPHEEQNKAKEAIGGGEEAARGDGVSVVSP